MAKTNSHRNASGAKAYQLRKELEQTRQALLNTQEELRAAQEANAFLQADRAKISDELARHIHMLQDTWNSTSWRITAPFRWGSRRLSPIRRKLFPPRNAVPSLPAPKDDASWPAGMLDPVPRKGKRKSAVLKARHPRRLIIFFFYDKDGVVDPYVPHLLRALKQASSHVLVVVGGFVTPEGESRLRDVCNELFIRENKGFDAWCYREAIRKIGYRHLARYDEVVLTNHTVMGPVASFDHMFEAMGREDVDFWGMTSHPGLDFDPFGCCPYGKLPAHIQSYFLVFRRRMIREKAFSQFWDNLPMIHQYNQAVGLFEGVLTRYFSDRGYQWNTFIPRGKYDEVTDNPMITMPVEMIRDNGCPVFKRRVFFQDLDYIVSFTAGQAAVRLMEYLQTHGFPMKMVWENLLRTCHLSGLAETMHLTRILAQNSTHDIITGPSPRVALFMHLYDVDMAEEMAGYAASMPENADIHISTTSEEKKAAIAHAFRSLPNSLDIRVCPNRGRDVSGLLTTFRKIALTYDYICVTHDKRTSHIKPESVGEGFAYQGYQNILASREYVQNILSTFAREPQLGLVCAPPPNHADFATQIGLEWAGNLSAAQALAHRLELHVPMDEAHYPYAPYGSNFFARTAALAPLLSYPWIYDDFPEEPMKDTDGTLLHAIERIYPYVAQHAGYYTVMVMTDRYCAVELGNLQYYAQTYAQLVYESGIRSRFIGMRDMLDMCLS